MKNSVIVEAVTDESGTEYRVKATIADTALHSDWASSEARAEAVAKEITALLITPLSELRECLKEVSKNAVRIANGESAVSNAVITKVDAAIAKATP